MRKAHTRAAILCALPTVVVICVGIWMWVSNRGTDADYEQQHVCNDLRNCAQGLFLRDSRVQNRLQEQVAFDETKLSWRVQILPIMQRKDLYEAFHLDEPWDSPHNLTLLEHIPSVFRPFDPNVPLGMTCFVQPIEARNAGREYKLESLALMGRLIEVPPALAVPWTKPDDLSISDPRIQAFREWFAIVTVDSTVQTLASDEVTPENLKSLFTVPATAKKLNRQR